MRMWMIVFMALFVGMQIKAQEQEITAPISEVTVFLNGAQVTRTSTVELQEGRTSLKLKGLSDNIDPQSIQAHASGNFKILSVLHELDYLMPKEKSANIRELETREEALKYRIEDLQALLGTYREEKELILRNQEVGSEQSGVRAETLKSLADYYRERLKALSEKRLETRREIIAEKEKLLKVRRQLTELNVNKNKPSGNIVVEVETGGSVSGGLEIAYLVRNAGWTPLYDVRVSEVGKPMELIYKANVYQQTGNDWSEVELILSTADPSQSGQKPELKPWYLNFSQPVAYSRQQQIMPGKMQQRQYQRVTGRVVSAETGEPLPGVTVQASGTGQGTVTDKNGNYALRVPAGSELSYNFVGMQQKQLPVRSKTVNVAMENKALALSEIKVNALGSDAKNYRQEVEMTQQAMRMGDAKGHQSGGARVRLTDQASGENLPVYRTSAEFAITQPYSIPSDGREYSVDIETYEVPAIYEYYCAPKLDPDAFLVAKINDWEDFQLLQGDMNLFFEGTFIGNAYLDLSKPADTLILSLGRDKDISVKRTKKKEESSSQLIGSNKKIARTFEIQVKNNKAQDVQLILEDQFPVSRHEDIKVERGDHPGASLNNETGLLRWNMRIPASTSQAVRFNYSVKYPKSKRVLIY